MNEVIKVTLNDNHEPVVSGRQLHEALEVKTEYKKWFSRMTEYGFNENEDFLKVTQKCLTSSTGQNTTDHIIKLDMAKEIAMIQRTDKGKEVRQYFIQVEKDFNSPEKIMARALLMADKKIHKLETQIEADKPKVLFADAVSASYTSILIGRLTSTPELHKTNNDKSVARATIAVNRRYKDQNGEREADFVNMVLWGRLAESLASYATKGSLISVDGELRTRRFEKNGQMNYVTEVLVTGFQLLESRAQRAMRENNAGQDLADLVLEEEELPF